MYWEISLIDICNPIERIDKIAEENNIDISDFEIIDKHPTVRGVVHSFTDNKKNLKKCLERGFYVGVNGLATYSTLPLPPLDKILLETDAPFLAPVPHRGEQNDSSYIPLIAEWLAGKLNVSVEEVMQKTTENCFDLFKFDKN